MTDKFHWDKKLRGFGKRTRNGKHTWIFQYKIDNQTRRIRIGGSELSETRARQLAQAEKGKLAAAKLGHGLDPAAEREKRRAEAEPQARNVFASILPIYLDARRDGIKPGTYELTFGRSAKGCAITIRSSGQISGTRTIPANGHCPMWKLSPCGLVLPTAIMVAS